MPSGEFLILFIIIVAGFAYIIFSQQKSRPPAEPLDEVRTGMHAFREVLRSMQESMDRIFTGVSKDLGQMQEIGRQMQDLHSFLRSPKLRGTIGEELLRDLLEQHLPRDAFLLQHAFRQGSVVDAVIKTKNGLIPIDAKFPLENFRRMMKTTDEHERTRTLREFERDVKRHIDAISTKYILPTEGTVDFAIMYVPSEALYYELMMHEEGVSDYARGKRVFLVSPNSFYYFLQTIVMGLQQQRYAEGAQKVLVALQSIREENRRLGEALRLLHRHMTNAKNTLDSVETEYQRLTSEIRSTQMIGTSKTQNDTDKKKGEHGA